MSQSIRTGDVNELSFINPKGLYDPAPNGYSHLAVFPAEWRMILPAGQGGETENQFLSDDFRAQLKQALRNTEIVLAAAGAKLSDVAKFTLYVCRSRQGEVPDHTGGIRPCLGRPEAGMDAGAGASLGA